MKYNIWNKWDPLKVCMLGNNYAPEFFNGVNDKVADPLKRICEETLEDLEGYKKILQDFGVEVIQPELDPNERFLDNPHRYPRGPLQPRDNQLVLGNKCYGGGDHPAIVKRLQEYGQLSKPEYSVPFFTSESKYKTCAGADWPSWEEFLSNRKNKDFFEDFVWQEALDFSVSSWISSACCFMIGTKLFIGTDPTSEVQTELVDITGAKEFDIHLVDMDGHSDANYHPIKPGAILSLCDVQTYEKTFPGWDVCYLPDQSWLKVKGFTNLKEKNKGKWWLAGEEDNDEFTYFVETWLGDWVGYVEETVFDVNVLMLDEYHCCVSNPNNEQVNTFLKKHKVEPVYVPWRHRYFWDGGLHCITLDLYREGTQKDYFE
jgi:hypothetical protein